MSTTTTPAVPPALPGDEISAGLQAVRINRSARVPGVEAEEAQDAEIIFFETLMRVANENHAALARVFKAAAR